MPKPFLILAIVWGCKAGYEIGKKDNDWEISVIIGMLCLIFGGVVQIITLLKGK